MTAINYASLIRLLGQVFPNDLLKRYVIMQHAQGTLSKDISSKLAKHGRSRQYAGVTLGQFRKYCRKNNIHYSTFIVDNED